MAKGESTRCVFQYVINERSLEMMSFEINYAGGFMFKMLRQYTYGNIYTLGFWVNFVITWRNSDGLFTIYINGSQTLQGNFQAGKVIGDGAILIGQEADSYVGKFDYIQSFEGQLTDFNMWDRVLSTQEIRNISQSCGIGEGNFFKWSDLPTMQRYGMVEVKSSLECLGVMLKRKNN